ncbi:MAG TPA: MOSC N-terminal beta barrel domain-containing protein [Candidatus Didemnitutus sp.]|nr:MOSC N-terminal beta barrel domain-containing protein [Candidatus Didemnitutus sp.]
MPRVASLHIYPVKSCRGIDVSNAQVDQYGFVGDRRFLIVTPEGQFITQRQVPVLATIVTELRDAVLRLSAPNRSPLDVSRFASHGTRQVTVWRDTMEADDCGDEPAAWLGGVLGFSVRLVRIGATYHRPVRPAKAMPGDVFSFADGYPFLILSEASLTELNDRIVERGADGVPMNRFRPNIVVVGCAPFAEDGWTRIRVGGVTLRNGGPCARCIITTTDQSSGERQGKEPLATLATFRRSPADPSDVNFGINLIHEIRSGEIRVGDEVEVL